MIIFKAKTRLDEISTFENIFNKYKTYIKLSKYNHTLMQIAMATSYLNFKFNFY